MAAPRKKVDEDENTKALREVASIGQNKFCFDCNQRGPTYVNMTIGSFVCTSCSGHLRGLNPPHRVKSISMASFTPEEIDFIRCRGNEFCNKVWGPPRDHAASQVLAGDTGRVTSLMMQKYEQKRWYVQPTDEMYADARRLNNTWTGSQADVGPVVVSSVSRPVYQMSGSQSVPNIHGAVHSVQRPSPGVARTVSILSSTSSPKPQLSVTSPSVSAALPNWHIVSTADPFAAAPQPHLAEANFANFANFSSALPSSTVNHQQMAPHSTTSLQGGAAFVASPGLTVSPNDKYAALANVSNAVGAVNWDGSAFTNDSDATPRPSGDQFVASMCNHFADHSLSRQSNQTPFSPLPSLVVNPFSVSTTPPSMPVAQSPFFNPGQYVLVQTGSGTCYMPAAAAYAGSYVTSQYRGAVVAPPSVYTPASPMSPLTQHFGQPPLHYASNPFLSGVPMSSPGRRDVTNPFL